MSYKWLLGTAALLGGLAMGGMAYAADLVTNGSFEDNAGIGQFNVNTSANGWTVTGTGGFPNGYAFIFKNDSAFAGGSPGEFGNVALWPGESTPQGDYFYGVDSTFHPSALMQTINGLKVGTTYKLTFEWAAAQQQGFDGASRDFWEISLGGETHDTTPFELPSHGFSGWMGDSLSFTATGTSEVLNLVNVGCFYNANGDCITDTGASGAPPFSLIDSVSLTVPEPTTWAMLVIGFAGLGYAGLRGRRRAAMTIA